MTTLDLHESDAATIATAPARSGFRDALKRAWDRFIRRQADRRMIYELASLDDRAVEFPRIDERRGSVRLEGLRVLVVDDHADARELLGLVLRERGAVVHLARNAAEALEVLEGAAVDVLVSDLAMPGTDGYALIAAVRSGRAAGIPAVALTAYAGSDAGERAIAAGFTAHATKPLDPDDLLELIVKLARR